MSYKYKVLFVVNSLGKGGAERVVVNIANKMAEEGNSIFIITFDSEISYTMNENIEIINIQKSKNKLLKYIKTIIDFNKIIGSLERDKKFDVITSHLPFSNLICRLSSVRQRSIHVIHGVYSMYEARGKMLLSIILKFLYDGGKVVTVSNGVKAEMLSRYNLKPEYIKTIYNPIDIEKIKKLSNEKVDFNDKYLMYCGRLEEVKQPQIAIEAFAKGEFYKQHKLIILGDGSMKGDLISLCKKYKVEDNVVFLGWENNVYKWMKNCEMLMVTSKFESFSMAIVEALCCNCKVVSVDCDFGPREILKGEYKQYLSKVNDIDDLIRVINKALKSYPNNLHKKIEEFNIDNIIKEYKNLK